MKKKEDYPVVEIPLEEMHPFINHPFLVKDDQAMADLAESIKQHGIFHPALVRKDPKGGYEIISGHRRHMACGKAGLTFMPARILDIKDEEAVICMTDANFYQRDTILPSEKAKAYRMKFDALKHQGKMGGITMDQIGEAAGESGKTVQRFIRLSYLSDEMLQMVDDHKIGIVCGVNFSYLDKEEQDLLVEMVNDSCVNITKKMSEQILSSHREHPLKQNIIEEILFHGKEQKRKLVLKEDFLKKYFHAGMTSEEILGILENMLEERKAGELGG